MAVNPYDPCPCGSGKKFKWCCISYWDQLQLAMQQQQQGQHDAALRTMEELTHTQGSHPQVWCHYANVLFMEGKTEEAEQAVQKALSIQPDFPMAYFTRAMFRNAEGEVIGSLLLFRKALEAYPPEATGPIADTCEMIARIELMLNRPVACRAVFERAVNALPHDPEIRQQFDAMFGPESRLPAAARKGYTFRPTMRSLPTGTNATKFSDAKAAYDSLTKQIPEDPAAWFNLGLVRAWLGEQPQAVEALNKSLELEVDDYRAEETAALAEVLKCAQGMEADADYVEHRAFLQIRDPQAVSGLLQAYVEGGRMIAPQMSEDGTHFSALVVEALPSILETGTKLAKVVANINITAGVIRLWYPVEETLRKVVTEVRERLNLAVSEPTFNLGPIQFGDIALDALAYPVRTADVTEAENKLRDYATNYFENTWLHKPLRSLGGVGPMDAVGSKLMRKRVLGIIKFVEGCLLGAAPRKRRGEETEPIQIYDFNRLRHKLGIEMVSVAAPTPVPQAPAAPTPAKRDFTAMNAADLSALASADLSASELEDAMKAAIKLDARELAVAFAKTGTTKPYDAAKPDRYPFFACLMTAALSSGDTGEVVRVANEGSQYDSEHNAGKRFNDYALRKIAVLAKKGEYEAVEQEYNTILDRTPNDGNLYVKAAETFLGAKQGSRAKGFAERGLAKGKEQGNRDLQAACGELLDAAKRYS
ncbi:SEC-C domain-containing protein [Limnoglobus roseus]|uniref:Tetratricopeptide repeat protein n=1 Tax=Limnoglobus roseus TaxID=2598579 RepID=A0A5C1AHL0_9BACT|nr:SEC-C domain-containing protein [Limnoglobus roseus]QEL18929.1 tetratricopeptide repeat protein [Limnoglobus roseus]